MVNLKSSTSTPALTAPKRVAAGKPPTPSDAALEAELKMPHERDESLDMTAAVPDPVIKQAAADVERGLLDTSKGAELNRAYKKLK